MASSTAERYLEIDLLRTIAILCMIVYHAAYDLAMFFGARLDPFAGGWLALERVTANLFLLLVGVSFAVSAGRMERAGKSFGARFRRNAARAGKILLAAALVSLATYLFDPAIYVRFGILHLIGASVLFLPLFLPLREWNAVLAIPVFLMGRLTGVVSHAGNGALLLPFGWIPPDFRSIDYFPVFPWFSAILLGIAIGNLLYNRNILRRHLRPTGLTRAWTAPGRRSLIIYLLHQPILLGILWMMFHGT